MAIGELDPRAPVVDEDVFTLAAELELRQAIRLQYYVSVLALHVDAQQSETLVDWLAFHKLIAETIRDSIRSGDIITVLPTPPHLRVLLVSPYLEDLPAIIGRIVTAVDGRAFGDDATVALSIGGACFPTTARSRAELFQQATALSVEARAARGPSRHRYRLAGPAS
jgi:hypothetical protein